VSTVTAMRSILLIGVVLAVGACSSDAPAASSGSLGDDGSALVCTTPNFDLSFETEMATCGAAMKAGAEIAASTGEADSDDDAELLFGTLCEEMQSGGSSVGDSDAARAAAAELDEAGVCPARASSTASDG
jgi:hypothetical protein